MNNKQYPSQDEAQMMADWWYGINHVYTGSSDIRPETKQVFENTEKLRTALHAQIFGVNSPWSCHVKRLKSGDKLVVYWDNDKATRLGLTNG